MISSMLTCLRGLHPQSACHALKPRTAQAIHTGSTYHFERLFNAEEVESFLKLTGDTNPIHRDRSAAIKAGGTLPILPGILCASLFPAVIASNFPGAVYLSQKLKFRKLAQTGEKVTVEIKAQQTSGKHVRFATMCFNSEGDLLIEGEALASLPMEPHRNA